jgi:hypothetical protein
MIDGLDHRRWYDDDTTWWCSPDGEFMWWSDIQRCLFK